MDTIVKRGKATVSGVVGDFDVIIYPEPQSAKLSQDFESEVIKNRKGSDVAELARNEKINSDVAMKLLGDTAANAKAGAAFLAPLAVVTVSGADVGAYAGKWTLQNGSDIDLGNTKVGDISFKFKRYTDADQNTLMTTAPA